MKNTHKKSAFTLIELIIVIAIIAILAAAIFVAVDPARRLNQSRNSRRSTDIATMLEAIIKYQVDNSGTHIDSIESIPLGDGQYYMIGTCQDADLNTGYDAADPADGSPAEHEGVNAASVDAVDHSIDNCTALGVNLIGNPDLTGDNVSAFYDADATDAAADAFCLDLTDIVDAGYMATVPYDPTHGDALSTRYYLERKSNGSLLIGACEPEGEGPGGSAPIPDIDVMR